MSNGVDIIREDSRLTRCQENVEGRQMVNHEEVTVREESELASYEWIADGGKVSLRKRAPDSRGGTDNSWSAKSISAKNQAARKGEERPRAITNAL
jgi:hypothetical protein